jgi:hypothetical protein
MVLATSICVGIADCLRFCVKMDAK